MIGLKSMSSINIERDEQDKKLTNSTKRMKKDLLDFQFSNNLNEQNNKFNNFNTPNITNIKGSINILKNNSSNILDNSILNRDKQKFNNIPTLSKVGNNIIGGNNLLFKKHEPVKYIKINQSSKIVPPILLDKIEKTERNEKYERTEKTDRERYINSPFQKYQNKSAIKSIKSVMLSLNNSSNQSTNNLLFSGNGNSHNRSELTPVPSSNRSSLEIFQENLYQENNKINKNILDLSIIKKNNLNETATERRNINDVSVIQDMPAILPSPIRRDKERDRTERHNLSVNHSNSSQNILMPIFNEFSADTEVLISNINLFELWIDIENNCEIKTTLQHLVKKYLTIINDEILVKNTFKPDLFMSQNVNKIYHKILKLQMIAIVFIKFSLVDLTFDLNIKMAMKKMISSLTIPLVNMFDLFIIKKISRDILKNSLNEKVIKILKTNKISRNNKLIDLFYQFGKHVDNAAIIIKQFSNSNLKFTLLKPIHNQCTDLVKSINSYSIYSLALLVIENVLYGVMHLNNSNEKSQDSGSSELKTPIAPFLPPDDRFDNQNNLTLVLDLDETLIHHFYTPSGGTFLNRPGMFRFLKELSELYEIVVFTAGTQSYADGIIDTFDKDYKYIKHRLYRHHTTFHQTSFVKDLSIIGRDLTKVIMIDNLPENFRLQPNNGFFIKTWNDEIKDHQLFDFLKLLKEIHSAEVKDVRVVVKNIKAEVNKRMSKNSQIQNPYADIKIKDMLAFTFVD